MEEKLTLDAKTAEALKRAHYGIYGHSAVEICHWTKEAIRKKSGCYKNKFYGIQTHQCMEFTPTAVFCENRCIYCWRPNEFYRMLKIPEEWIDEPEEIVKNLEKERKKLLIGFMGDPNIDKDWLKDAFTPTHYSISLSGEPTMYPKLPELIKYLKSLPNTKSIFLVTNGQEPEMLKRLIKEDALPTQVYLSMNAYDESEFININRPMYKDAWKRWLESLKLLNEMNTRTVIRITLIKGYNDKLEQIPKAAELIRMGNPHFVEVKSYMHIGYSQSRLSADNMLTFEEIKSFTLKLLSYLSEFVYMDDMPRSLISVIQNLKRYTDRWIIQGGSYTK
jgi:tRNA wybutosine-synthesizing protein 1